ncbi:MAG: hypothetical protein ACRCWQ_10785 [Bacilli bacterium]
MAQRPIPMPILSPFYNRAVMDVHLNNYDIVYIKPIEDKLDAIKPVVFVKSDLSEVEVQKIKISDRSKATYDPLDKSLTLNLDTSPVGALKFTDLIGVPNSYPKDTDLKTGHAGVTGADETSMVLVAKSDGIYFVNHPVGSEIEPRKSRSKQQQQDIIESLEARISFLESKLK